RERGALEEFLPEAAARSSFRERAADAAENELIERKKIAFMAARLGEEFEGVISGVEPFGLFVGVTGLFIDGVVPLEALQADRDRYVERRRILQGERRGRVLALGDPVRVRLDKVNSARLEIEFDLLEARPGARAAGVFPTVQPAAGRRARGRARGRGARGAPGAPGPAGAGRRGGRGAPGRARR